MNDDLDLTDENYESSYVFDEETEREVLRRAEEHRAGRGKTVDFETFKRMLREALEGHRIVRDESQELPDGHSPRHGSSEPDA